MYNKKYSYEVMIIGGGPAGNAAANCLAQNGIKTVVVDAMPKLGDKLCTGIIGMECAQLIPPDRSLIYRESSRVTIIGPDDATYDLRDSNNHAFIIDRVSYVADIADTAQSHGADYLLEHKVIELKIGPKAVCATTVSPQGMELISSEIVIIASGFGSNLISMVGLDKHGPGDYLVGAQVVLDAPSIDNITLFTGDTSIPGSFGWLAPTVNGEAFLGGLYRKTKKEIFRKFLNYVKGQNVVSDPKGPIHYWGIPIRPLKKTFGPRTLVVGDAAGFAKPTTGGGIYYAILSGLLAAETILSVGKQFDLKGMSLYETLWKRKFGRELDVGYYARLLYESLNDESLKVLLEKFASYELQQHLLSDNGFSFDWHSSTIRKTIRNPEMITLLNSLGPKSLLILGKMLKLVL